MTDNYPAAHEQYQIAALQHMVCLKENIADFLGKSPPAASREFDATEVSEAIDLSRPMSSR